jgi:hypothetical protein
MPSYVPAKYGAEYIFYVGLDSVATAGAFQSNPALVAGDFKISKDGGTLANLTTLPTVTPASGKMVKITLSATEMSADNVTVIASDAAGAEWRDLIVNIQTAARQIDDLAYPTTSGRGIDVTTGGEVGIDWANIGSPTTTVNLSGTTVKTATDVEADTQDIQSRIPAALVGGRIDANVGAISSDATAADNAEAFFDGTGYAGTNNVIPTVTTATNVTTVNGLAAGVITGTAIAANAITDDKVASDVTIASVTGAVGSVTGNVGGSVASVTAGVTVTTNNDKVGYSLSSAGVQAIWDALTSALTTVGSIGKLLADNINATISSRSSHTAANVRTEMDSNSTQLAKLGTPAGASVSADIAAIKAETASIKTDTNDLQTQIGAAGAGLTAVASATNLATLTAYVDTEVAAIKAKTDNLPALPANEATLTTIAGYLDTEVAAILAAVDTEVAAIKTVTDALPNGGALTTITNNVAAILADTGTDGVVVASGSKTGYSLAADQSAVTVGTVNDLGATARGRVNAEVLDVLNVDTFAEPSAVPAATSTLVAKIQWLFALARNKITQNATTQTLRNDADSASIGTSTVSDDGTTMSRGEWS